MQTCSFCATRLQVMERLESVLDSAAADSLPGDFNTRLLARLAAERQSPEPVKPVQPKQRFVLRPEIVNVMVAAAATYLFVASGALKLVVALDQASLESQVFSRLGAAVKVVGQWFGSFN
ncbi:hypothetical protein DQG13_22610 [Paenibacillus sp. YN15]|nr:hypothetical protein DQG13_22610 [Paenibacillus sp. YN15]